MGCWRIGVMEQWSGSHSHQGTFCYCRRYGDAYKVPYEPKSPCAMITHKCRIAMAVSAIVLVLAWDIYDWVFVSNGPAYFASDWRTVLLVAAISVVVGLAVLFIMRLPEERRRRFAVGYHCTMFFLAIAGSGGTAWLCWRARELFKEGVMVWGVFALMFVSCATVAGLSLPLWRKARRRNPQNKPAAAQTGA
jgi:hypothetical protein